MSDETNVEPAGEDRPAAPPATRSAPKAGIPSSTVVVGALLILVVGFVSGFVVGHHRAVRFDRFPSMRHLEPGDGMVPGQPSGGYGAASTGGVGIGGTTGATGFAPTALAGTVIGIEGDTVSIRTLLGDTVAIHVSSATLVRLSRPGGLSDLSPGSGVVVIGRPDGAGGFTAARVIEGTSATG